MATARQASTANGAWLSDIGEKLAVPHPTGDYDQITQGCTGKPMYRKAGHLHRLDGPAVVWDDGTQLWFFEGKLHRDGGPAVHGGPGRSEHWREGVRLDVAFDDEPELDDLDETPAIAAPVATRRRRTAKV